MTRRARPTDAGSVAAVPAVFGPPAGRRSGWVAVVSSCPGCSAMHVHRARPDHDVAGEPLVRRCRSTGVEYHLTVARPPAVSL